MSAEALHSILESCLEKQISELDSGSPSDMQMDSFRSWSRLAEWVRLNKSEISISLHSMDVLEVDDSHRASQVHITFSLRKRD